MKKVILMLSVAVPVFSGAPAIAQDAPQAVSSDDRYADAIVVTARRRAEDVSKVPIAITAFSGDQLVAKGVQNIGDLTKLAPGLNVSGGGTRANPFVVIRGQSKAVTGNSSPGVITYMNDVPLPTNGSLIQTYDMENIQVLKGPQGTLFGRNSIGGALLTVTKGPNHEFGGYMSGEIANHDTYQIEGAVNVPIVKDKIALRLASQVGYSGSDIKTYRYSGYTVTAPTPGTFVATPGTLQPSSHNLDDFATESYRASLLIEPTDWIKNVTVGDYSKIRGTNNTAFDKGFTSGALFGSAGFVPVLAQCSAGTINCNLPAAFAAAANSIPDRYNFTTQDPWVGRAIVKGVTNTTTIKLSDNHQLKNIFAIRTTDVFTNASLTGLPISSITTASQTKLKQTTEEIQLSGSFFDNDLKYTVGGFFYNEKPNGLGGYQALEVNALLGLSHQISVTYLHNSSQAAYGQLDYSLDRLIPGLALTAGLRQTWDTQSACSVGVPIARTTVGASMLLTEPGGEGIIPSEASCSTASANVYPDAHFKKLTYTLGANWQVTPDAMLYVAHRRGYRAGGYNTPQIDPYLAAYQVFGPETLTDWEVGLKARFRVGDVRGSIDLALFTGKDTDNQVPGSTPASSAGRCVPEALGTPGHDGAGADACTTAGGIAGSVVKVAGATTSLNAADLTIRGVEAAGTLSPFRGLTFSGSLAYTQVRVDSITLSPTSPMGYFLAAIGSPVTPASVAIQGQPKWSSNAGVTVDYPDEILGGDLSATLDYHYTATYRSSQILVPSWHQIDASVGLANIGGTNLSATVYIKNLTNEITYLGTGASSPSTFSSQGYILGKARTVGLRLKYKFGSQ